MELTLKSHNKRVKENIIKDHYWYDSNTKQILHEKGGKMVFVYDRQTKRSMPKIVNDEQWVYKNTYSDIIKWINNNKNYVLHTVQKVPELYVIIDIDAKSLSSIEESLYRHHIQYDYDEIELKYELKGGETRWQNSQSKWQIRLPH